MFKVTIVALVLAAAVQGFTPLRSPLMARRSAAASGTWAMAMDKVFVAGGTKGVGREVVNLLTAQGKQCVVLARSEESAGDVASTGAQVVIGDAMHYKTVEGAMDGCDAAITTLGGPTTEDGKRVDYEGNRNVIEAAGILGVTRLILVTSIGCRDSKPALSDEAYETLKPALEAKDKAENMLVKFYSITTDYTIIRPGGLTNGEASGKAILTADNTALGAISRADVASLVVKALEAKNTHKKTLAAVDPTIETPYGGHFGEDQAVEL